MIELLRKVNFWDEQEIRTGCFRKSYIDRFRSYLNNSLVKVLLGQRRVGKSYLLRMLIKTLTQDDGVPRENILYLNKDLHYLNSIDNAETLLAAIHVYQQEFTPQGKIYIFIDEIQEITGWEKVINSLSQDYTSDYEIFITGSNAKLLSGELATYLAGRYITFEVFPFSYEEFLDYHNLERGKASYLDYMQRGGIPESYLLQDEEMRTNYFADLRNSIVLRDIIQRHSIRDAALLQSLVELITDSIGSMFSPNKVVKYLSGTGVKANFETITNYLGYLCDAYYIHECPRFDLRGKKILGGERKYYLNDTSFKYALTSSFDMGPSRFLENNAYLHFRRQGYRVYVGREGNREIDFVLDKDGDRRYVQVAYLLPNEEVINREFGNLAAIRDNYEKTVVSLDDVNIGNIEGIAHLNAWDL